jgi:hypothetical protein
LSFGIAQEIGSITSAPFGEKENFADASPRVPARGPRRASLSLVRRPPPSGTVVHCGCAGARKGRGRQTFCLGFAVVKLGSRPNRLPSAALWSVSYLPANVCAAKARRSFGNIRECLSHAWKLPALVSTTAHGLKPSAESPQASLAQIVQRGVKMLPRSASVYM